MTTPQSALADLQALACSEKTANMHKPQRPSLGITNPQIDVLYKTWRSDTDIPQRIAISAHLWDSNIHEARIAAAKLLTQARINPDAAVWAEITRWLPALDGTAIADAVYAAGARRLTADHARLDTLGIWLQDENIWVRRTALMMTLPWAKMNHPSDVDLAVRGRVLDWAAQLAPDHRPLMQKAIALWLRTLSKHAPTDVGLFLEAHGNKMKPFAVKQASALI